MQNDVKPDPNTAIRTATFIWLAMLANPFILASLVFYMNNNLRADSQLDSRLLDILTISFSIASAIAMMSAFMTRRSYQNRQEIIPAKDSPPLRPVGQYFTNMLICLFLSDIPALLGVVHYMLGSSLPLAATLIVASIASIISFKPSMAHIEIDPATTSKRQMYNR